MTEQLAYQPSRSAVYYKPPRRVEPRRLAVSAAVGVVVLIGLATAYALVLPLMETIYTRVGTLAAFAGATGLVSLAVLYFGRVSSQALAAVVACALGLLAVYVAWVVWLEWFFRTFLHTAVPVWRLILRPMAMFRIAREINHHGTWTYGRQGDEPITGIPLLLCWLIEAGGVVTASVFIGLRATDPRSPTCPECHVPCKYLSGMPRLAADRADDVPAIAESQDFTRLLSLGPLAHPDDPEVNFHLYRCPRCGMTNVLSAYRTAWTVEGGRARVKSRTLVDRMLIGPAHVEQLKAVKQQLVAKADAATSDEVASGEDSAATKDETPSDDDSTIASPAPPPPVETRDDATL